MVRSMIFISSLNQFSPSHNSLLQAIKQKLHMRGRHGDEPPVTDVQQEEDKAKMLLGAKLLVRHFIVAYFHRFCYLEAQQIVRLYTVEVFTMLPSYFSEKSSDKTIGWLVGWMVGCYILQLSHFIGVHKPTE